MRTTSHNKYHTTTIMEDVLRQAAQKAIASWQAEDETCDAVHEDCAFWVTNRSPPSFGQGQRPAAFLPRALADTIRITDVKILSHQSAAAVQVTIGDNACYYKGFIVFLKQGNGADAVWQAISVGLSPPTVPVLPAHFDAVTALTWKGYCHASRICDGKLMAEYFHETCRLTFTDVSSSSQQHPKKIVVIDAPTFYGMVQNRYTTVALHAPYRHIGHDHALVGQFDSLLSIDFVSPTLALVLLRVGHPPCLWTDLLTCACDEAGRWWIVHKSSENDPYLLEYAKNDDDDDDDS